MLFKHTVLRKTIAGCVIFKMQFIRLSLYRKAEAGEQHGQYEQTTPVIGSDKLDSNEQK